MRANTLPAIAALLLHKPHPAEDISDELAVLENLHALFFALEVRTLDEAVGMAAGLVAKGKLYDTEHELFTALFKNQQPKEE